MGADQTRDVYIHHREVQDKYTYFLLAVTASAIAFSVQKTDTLFISWSLIPIGLAVLSWCVSFYCGCKNLVWIQLTLYANLGLLQLNDGSHPELPHNLYEKEAAKQGVKDALDRNASIAQKYAIWQYRFLTSGAVLFLVWHILEMILRTYGYC
tara:strand:- start:33419 stop:33877 length:459 start_codon:yes stop_codon:yes gene_type:complete